MRLLLKNRITSVGLTIPCGRGHPNYVLLYVM
jgi:hypothetical protein